MNLFQMLFGNLFQTKKEQYVRYAQASIHRETIGKVNAKVMNVQSEIDRKVFAAQRKVIDTATGKEKKRQEQLAQQQAGARTPQQPTPQQQQQQQAPKQPQAPAKQNPGQQPPRPQGNGDMGLFGDNKNANARRPPQGPPRGAPPQDPYWQGQQPMYPPQQPQGQAPVNYGGGQEKTQAIDLRALKQKNERQVVGWLVAVTGDHRGTDFRLYDGKNVIGTSADCDIVITDAYLSARHCTVRYENGNFVIIDLDSRNHTYVNQKQISKEDLIDNDTVRIGKTELKFKSLY
jgi:hypothetical protein